MLRRRASFHASRPQNIAARSHPTAPGIVCSQSARHEEGNAWLTFRGVVLSPITPAGNGQPCLAARDTGHGAGDETVSEGLFSMPHRGTHTQQVDTDGCTTNQNKPRQQSSLPYTYSAMSTGQDDGRADGDERMSCVVGRPSPRLQVPSRAHEEEEE